jgi:hypothetical protein
MKKTISTLVLLLILTCSNTSKIDDPEETILVRIAGRSITAQDFLNRMELSPRPFYCSGSSEEEKAIALNSMIAEKMLAIEAGDTCRLLKNELFSAYIKGRKEQLMRDKLYEIEAIKKVKLDSISVNKGIKAAQMNYEVEFLMLPKETAAKIQEVLSKKLDTPSQIFEQLSETYRPQSRKVNYLDNDMMPIQEALFNKPIPENEVVGPIDIDDGNTLFLRIKDFKYSPALSVTEHARRAELVIEKMTFEQARANWDDYVYRVMDGKNIRFDRSTFEALLKMFSARTMRDDSNPKPDDITGDINDVIIKKDDQFALFLDEPFFSIDSEVWTVGDFRKLVMSHPIVFRDDEINSPREFVKAFRTAVLDVIQDHTVNQEGYKRKLDKLPGIQRKTRIWQDFFLAKYQQEKYLDQIRKRSDFDPENLKGNKNTYIDTYIDSLQQYYQNKIELNVEEYNKIKLSNTQMIGIRPKVPYPDLVPAFPANAIDADIEYIIKIL